MRLRQRSCMMEMVIVKLAGGYHHDLHRKLLRVGELDQQYEEVLLCWSDKGSDAHGSKRV